MQTKLTLRLESELIKTAKLYAESSGKSLSQIVSDYFEILQHSFPKPKKKSKHPPITESLIGLLQSDQTLDQKDYQHHLERKYL